MEDRKMNSDKVRLKKVLYDFYYRRVDKNLTDAIDVLQEILKYVKHINKDVTDKSGFVDPMENLDGLTQKLNENINNMGVEVKHLHDVIYGYQEKGEER